MPLSGLPLKPVRDLQLLCSQQEVLEPILKAQHVLVHITTRLNVRMIMWQAIQLWEYGLSDKYVEDPRFRQIYDLWCATEYCDMLFDEFLVRCGYPLSELMAAQTATDLCIIPEISKNTLANDASG